MKFSLFRKLSDYFFARRERPEGIKSAQILPVDGHSDLLQIFLFTGDGGMFSYKYRWPTESQSVPALSHVRKKKAVNLSATPEKARWFPEVGCGDLEAEDVQGTVLSAPYYIPHIFGNQVRVKAVLV